MVFLQLSDHAQRFAFFPGRQAVAALGLCGRRAKAEHFIQRGGGLRLQLLLACRLCCTHGGQDAAACGEDVQIARAVQLERQLVLPPAVEDQMRVRVDQTGVTSFPPALIVCASAAAGAVPVPTCAITSFSMNIHAFFRMQISPCALPPRAAVPCGVASIPMLVISVLFCLFLSRQRSSCATACSTTALSAT